MPTKSHRESKLKRLKKPRRAESYLKASFGEAIKDENFSAFFLALRDVIEAKGLNKTEIAEKANITRQHLHFLLSGEGNPTFSNVITILKVLGFSCLLIEESEKEAA